ncbi:hypothetical protein CC80DRAFT_426311 [Byssothecium circinans]|uniref:Fms interacting protein n=1 Tax=Byssothecium circinans TaxID=147558 RepID=A0A6A5TD85_9PLEO|nr:hypothetical protein CC80DRAFT_426311 [Byssothecium circinans]
MDKSYDKHPDSVDKSQDKLPDSFDPSKFDVANLIKTPHNKRVYDAIQNLKKAVNDLADYGQAHPSKAPNAPGTREDIDAAREIKKRERNVAAQLSLVKTLYRQSLLKVREEKAMTAEDKAFNDKLILGLSNLRYEEQSLRKEIKGAEKYDHKYTKLPLIDREAFLAKFPELASASEHELMIARIEHEHSDRLKLEERRQEKLKEKQKLFSEVKKSKENLTNLDSMVDRIEDVMGPIRKTLTHDDE